MDVEGALLNLLYQYEVLDEQETAEIRALTVGHKKNGRHLDFMMRTTPEQYGKFLEAIKESSQDHVYSGLSGELQCRRWA